VVNVNEPWWTLTRWAIVAAWTLLAVFAGDPAVRWVLRRAGTLTAKTSTAPGAAPESPGEAGTPSGTAAPSGTPAPSGTAAVSPIEAAGEQLRGGRVIGWLERLGTVAVLLAGFPAGIGAIVAVKGLARYPDLKASDGTAERFILGTFASLLIGAGGAGAAHWCLGLLP